MIPDPALVVLVGASGSGKSTWAAARYRGPEIVSSDDLRGVVGSGRHDLDATDDAFRLLEDIVAARVRRGLTCVVDTLGLDAARRRRWRALAEAAGLPAVVVRFDVPAPLARSRNAARARPVPAPALTAQLTRAATVGDELAGEGWTSVVTVASDEPSRPVTDRDSSEPAASSSPDARTGLRFVLQLSRFPWGDDPHAWLRDVALAADEAGFAGLALMDHLIQIPQVDRAWAPIPEPWTTLGLLAGLDTRLQLGTLVSPVTLRAPGVLAKAAATLDTLSGGRAFLGLGAGWFEREHAAYGLPFPPAAERLRLLKTAVPAIRALWAPGTKAAAGLPETTCYPRPVHDIEVIVGGSGRRTLAIAARHADAANVATGALDGALPVFDAVRAEAGRDVAMTVLDVPVVGRDRDEVWTRVETHRGRTAAAAFARRHFAGTYGEQRDRYARLADRNVRTVFLALPHLAGADDVLAAALMLRP
ncbi:MAG: LLM class flavin-dependent oxidoreductase [Jatrophihabitans sp.]|uniref:LLM class flavin-dependent oxidoreductase n=1 Tax=Jatrophihabitans sp. TaxID=1932789 RepID=UPI003F7DAAFF